MKCLLMNKNTCVLVAEYNKLSKFFDEIIEIINIDYAPLIIRKSYELKDIDEFKITLYDWFKGRGIPSWRDKLDLLLFRLNIERPEELLDKAFGLSLSDQYWIKPFDSEINYDDINFFDHDFDYSEFLDASLSNTSKIGNITDNALKTPNNTTDGMLKKAWTIKDNKRCLLKGGYKSEVLQPFNEVLASMICERLGFHYVPYTLEILNDKVVSSCECFINKDTEYIPASHIMYGEEKYKSLKDYDNYIKILEDNGISKAREKVENMFILDYLMMNEDRHMNNFGIIRDVNTLEWIDVAPIFDNGQSLNILSYDNDEIAVSGEGRLFYNIDKFDCIIKVVQNPMRIDLNKLDGIVEEFDELLTKYRHITGMSENRIFKLCVLLNNQIKKLKEIIDNL